MSGDTEHGITNRSDTSKPLVDITTLVSIESCFDEGPVCPSGHILAGQLADLFIWSDSLRYVQPVTAQGNVYIPDLITRLKEKQPTIVDGAPFSIDLQSPMLPESLQQYFFNFYGFVRGRPEWFKQWLTLHNTPKVKDSHRKWITRPYYFDPSWATANSEFCNAYRQLGVNARELMYAFDVCIRYPYYASLANEECYLSHPIRQMVNIPGCSREPYQIPQRPISFRDPVLKLVKDRYFTLESYLQFLLDAHRIVRDRNLTSLGPSRLERRELHAIARDLHLPAKLRGRAIVEVLVTEGLAMAAGAAVGGHLPEIVLGSTMVLSATLLWHMHVPPRLSHLRWIDVASESPFDDQARRKEDQ